MADEEKKFRMDVKKVEIIRTFVSMEKNPPLFSVGVVFHGRGVCTRTLSSGNLLPDATGLCQPNGCNPTPAYKATHKAPRL